MLLKFELLYVTLGDWNLPPVSFESKGGMKPYQHARVLTSSVSPSSLVAISYGNADPLIIETFEPESRSNQKSLQLRTV